MGRTEVNADYGPVCPRCASSYLVRSARAAERAGVPESEGLCERCSAQLAESQEAWQAWREECSTKAVRRSEILPPGYCLACSQPFGTQSEHVHKKFCAAKQFRCPCDRGFDTERALADHMAKQGHR